MSLTLTLAPLAISEVFLLRRINVHDYEGTIVLTVEVEGKTRLLHLFENEVEGDTLYGLSIGRDISVKQYTIFSGSPCNLEISSAKSERAWDFKSMSLCEENDLFKIGRNDSSFPEPTFFKDG